MGPTRIAVHARLRPAAERDGRVRDDDLFLVRASDDDLKGTISVPNALNLAERHVFRWVLCVLCRGRTEWGF